jgi:hypothetical protein
MRGRAVSFFSLKFDSKKKGNYRMRNFNIGIVGASVTVLAILFFAGSKIDVEFARTLTYISGFALGLGVLINLIESNQTDERIDNIRREFDSVYRYIDDLNTQTNNEIEKVGRNCSSPLTECTDKWCKTKK